MGGSRVLLIGAAAVAIGGIPAFLTIASRDAAPPRLSEAPPDRSAGDFRPPRRQPGGAARAKAPPPAWSLAKVMNLIDGADVTIDGRRVRIHSETALCSGRGAPRRVDTARVWQSFDCTYTTFTGLHRDLEFRVDVLGEKRYRVSDLRWLGDG